MFSKLLGTSVYPKQTFKPFVIGVCGGSCGGKTIYGDEKLRLLKKKFDIMFI